LGVVFSYCDWFDPIFGTRVDDFLMVEVKHMSHLPSKIIVLAHQAQQVYLLRYSHEDDDVDVDQPKIKGHKDFMVSNGT
jgi:hypothetical protein